MDVSAGVEFKHCADHIQTLVSKFRGG